MLFLLLVFLHVVSVFMAVAVAYGGVIFFILALRARKMSSVRVMAVTADATKFFIPALFVIGGVFGLIAAIVNGYNLLAPWLVIAYIMFAVLATYGGAITAPSISRIGAAVAAADDGTMPADVGKMASRFYLVEIVDFALLFFFIFDMVVKPFS